MPTALSWPEHVEAVFRNATPPVCHCLCEKRIISCECRHADMPNWIYWEIRHSALCFVFSHDDHSKKKTVDKTLLWQGKSGICLRVVMESSRKPVATRHVQFQSWRMYRVPIFAWLRIMPFGQWCIGSFVEFQPRDMSGTVVSFVLLGSVSILGGGCPWTGSRVDFQGFPFSGSWNEPLGSHKMALASGLKIRYPKR